MALNYGYNNSNFYMQDLQNMRDRIDRQMAQMQQQNAQQPAQIQQTFQLSNPQNFTDFDAKYIDNLEAVKNTLTLRNTLFVTKDMSTMWMKDASGNIKTYALTEVIEKDEKDLEIENLQKQLNEMKAMLMATQKEVEPPKEVATKTSKK